MSIKCTKQESKNQDTEEKRRRDTEHQRQRNSYENHSHNHFVVNVCLNFRTDAQTFAVNFRPSMQLCVDISSKKFDA